MLKKKLNLFFGALTQICFWVQKYVQIHHGFWLSKMVLKSVLTLKFTE